MLTYKKTVTQLLVWMDQVCRLQPNRCSIVFGGDINDYAGVPARNVVPDEHNPIGPFRPQQEHH
eukprot:5779369-Pyramimonas_sp.AAC.1